MHHKNILYALICLILLNGFASAQDYSVELTIHNRVDTTKEEVKKIIRLWHNYLESHPDSIYDNPWWNKKEKEQYEDFDFSRSFLYQFPSHQLLNYYKPTLLSVEKSGKHYSIRTLFYAEGLKGKYRGSNPWCITQLYAVNTGGQWKLKNALPVITEKWETTSNGKIKFHYPCTHQFNDSLAQIANEFCTGIAGKFEFNDWQPFDFYITDSGDEVGELVGFDFYFAGYTTGIGWNNKRILLSGLGSEYYPHEFIHMIVPLKRRHPMMEEGFATWQGGSGKKKFKELAHELATELSRNDTVSFKDILNKKWGWQYLAYYTTGAIILKKAYEEKGLDAMKKLFNTPPGSQNLQDAIINCFGIKQEELNGLIRSETLKYGK